MVAQLIRTTTLIGLFCLFAIGQDTKQEHEGLTIKDISFVGATDATRRSLQAKMKTQPDKPFSSEILNQDIKYLVEELKLFVSFTYRTVAVDGGIRLDVYVTENPRIAALVFLGLLEYSRTEILEEIESREGGLANELTLQMDRDRIIRKYTDKGFHFADVRVERRSEGEAGSTVIFHITEGTEVDIDEVRFEGATSFEKSDLLGAMPKTDEGWLFFGQEYVQRYVRADVLQLQQFYRGHGFLDATVTLWEEAFSPDKKNVTLVIRVDEGEVYKIRSLDIQGMKRFDPEETLAELKSKVGGNYEQFFALVEDRRELIRKYHDDAYINIRVIDKTRIALDENSVDVVLEIVEGERVHIGQVEIRGNLETKDKVLRRALDDLVPGSPLNLNELKRAQNRLRTLQFFEPSLKVYRPQTGLSDFEIYQNAFVRFEGTDRENIKDIIIDVDEVDTGSVRFAVGLGSNAGVVGSVIYTKMNFDPLDFPEDFGDIFDAFTGGGQRLQILIAPGSEISQYGIDYSNPYFFDTDYTLSASAFHRLYRRERWFETRTGSTVSVGRRFGRSISGWLRYRLERVDVDRIDSDAGQIVFDYEGERLVSSLSVSARLAEIERDPTSMVPVEGYMIDLLLEYAGIGGDISYNKIRATGEYYWTLSQDAEERRHVVYVRGTAGWVNATDDSNDVPIYERFFAGGHGSLRGFAFRGVGPMTNNAPDGGKVLLLGSVNYAFPVYEKMLRGVVFVDTGTLASDIDADELMEIRISAGVGVRMAIPFLGPTPFALDFALPLMKYGQDETQFISFSLERKF